MYQVAESLKTYTPLGIRFWDPLLDEQIREGLHVTASPESAARKEVKAYRTASDIYAFSGLPGMRSIENRLNGFEAENSPPIRQRFIITVKDLHRRFIPVAFSVDLPLPYHGVFLNQIDASPAHTSPRGCHLYSAPTRNVPALFTAVRGELSNMDTAEAAAHALVRITTEDERLWYGLADAQGRFAVLLPYPTMTERIIGSPAPTAGKQISEQTWDLKISVFYEPDRPLTLPGSDLKDYLSILDQQQGQIWPVSGGSPQTELSVVLRFGREIILRTEGSGIEAQAKLLIGPALTSP